MNRVMRGMESPFLQQETTGAFLVSSSKRKSEWNMTTFYKYVRDTNIRKGKEMCKIKKMLA